MDTMTEETTMIIVGAGPSGLGISACLSKKSIPHIVLEKEDCCASLWKKHTYDRLHLHLAKEYCSLPYKPHPASSPMYLSKNEFVQYLDEYVAQFNIKPRFCCSVESAAYDEEERMWIVRARNTITGGFDQFSSNFLVVASGENSKGFIPDVEGVEDFQGRVIHSSGFKSGSEFQDRNVLVVGCGNSGMEIAYDLCSFGAKTSIVIRSPFHVVPRELVRVGMFMLKYLPIKPVDRLIALMAKIKFGNLSKYGIQRPKEGPFYLKATKGRSPVIDVGTISKIKSGDIKVVPAISSVKDETVVFENGDEHPFDAIIFATGFRSMACEWLKDHSHILNGEGLPKSKPPLHWKGEKGLYCVGLSRMGLPGVTADAHRTADDIAKLL